MSQINKNNKKFKISRYLQVVKRKDGYAVYNSIFGNLCLLNQQAYDFLKNFEKEKTLQEVIKSYKKKANLEKIPELIKDFLKRGFLIEHDKDELSDFKKYVKNRDKDLKKGKEACIIQLVVSNKCNFRCKYCFVDTMYCSDERARTQKDPKNQIMKKKDAKKYIETVIKHIKINKRKNLFIQFFGGEPLVNWSVVKYVLNEFSDGKKYGINMRYSIVTNGSLITNEIAKYFKKFDVAVIVSFDSPKGTDRVLANGKNSNTLVKKNIKILHKYDNQISVNTAMTTKTFSYIDNDLVDFAVENGISEVGLVFDFNFDFYEKYPTQEIIKKFWEFYKYAKTKNIIVTGYWHHTFQLILEKRHYLQGGYKTCPATGALLSIEPSGVVYVCKGSSAYIGNMNEFDKIFSSKNYLEYSRHPFIRLEFCRDCEIENFCSNICPGSRERYYHSISKMHRPTCDLYKQLIKKLIKDLDPNNVAIIKMVVE